MILHPVRSRFFFSFRTCMYLFEASYTECSSLVSACIVLVYFVRQFIRHLVNFNNSRRQIHTRERFFSSFTRANVQVKSKVDLNKFFWSEIKVFTTECLYESLVGLINVARLNNLWCTIKKH